MTINLILKAHFEAHFDWGGTRRHIKNKVLTVTCYTSVSCAPDLSSSIVPPAENLRGAVPPWPLCFLHLVESIAIVRVAGWAHPPRLDKIANIISGIGPIAT